MHILIENSLKILLVFLLHISLFVKAQDMSIETDSIQESITKLDISDAYICTVKFSAAGVDIKVDAGYEYKQGETKERGK